MPMTCIIEDYLMQDFSEVYCEIGLPPSTAFDVFARTVVRERELPFPLSAPSSQERAVRAYEMSVADGIARGLAEMEVGDMLTREESRAMYATRGTTT